MSTIIFLILGLVIGVAVASLIRRRMDVNQQTRIAIRAIRQRAKGTAKAANDNRDWKGAASKPKTRSW